MNKELYYIETCFGCGIRAYTDLETAWRKAERESGEGNVKDVRLATEGDVAWVRGMGGYVPTLPVNEPATDIV